MTARREALDPLCNLKEASDTASLPWLSAFFCHGNKITAALLGNRCRWFLGVSLAGLEDLAAVKLDNQSNILAAVLDEGGRVEGVVV